MRGLAMKKNFLLIASILLMFFLSACGSNKIMIGSKSFTEQYLLTKMTVLLLKEEGFNVKETSDLGSSALRQALENNQIDLTWDYVGTGLVTYLGEEPETDPQAAFDRLNKIDRESNNIIWTNLNEVDNTYTLMMREDHAEELGINSISDLADYVNENPGELLLATDVEFANRDDGLPGVQEAYEFDIQSENVSEMEAGLTYNALRDQQVDIVAGFATDGRIDEFGFVNLEDDQSFFPAYNAAVAMSSDLYEEHPELEEIFEPLADLLTSDSMRKLNYEVDINDRSVDEVAREFLVENNLIEK